ncbi:N-acetylmuramoyl-L-alanine amidase [Listeria ivanovii]|uniref:N-acetylmuramoyl-L-alanine amidase n=1 Tax=Listeria ivanovii TaxID=1638 RepID=UPI0002DDB32C|nr:N-acetylmuramoyl-L-alanine amidase [Listeria ivanovii]MBC1760642.1 N-acetylmuramoyl-L-alanine amidase [Listeria ivanovii]MBK3915642.1 N-acetylmuramoyl-L-alanine amidase [Listeria ivanovii subsp. ivanovii]MBK3922808.1 N-acetylmuramoyl-L-alanine amidase [Listeria ivanovii subsp. ivanovii]MBK3927968.1 N-acetylmuramoyl-L-alanine amidase [Listeria ivanovii subsp. ivanovii]MCJ1718684.1 N-acetylmuramoyl-L-alanine amidase [Listeria ivanovii]
MGNGLVEKNWVLAVAKLLQTELMNAGFEVGMTRTDDTFYELSKRAQRANSFKANLFISIHFNAGGGMGYEDYIFTSTPERTEEIQKIIHKKVIAKVSKHGMRDRGMKKANFAVLRETAMDAILLEAGFCDSSDAVILKTSAYQKDFCLGIVEAVKEIFDVTVTKFRAGKYSTSYDAISGGNLKGYLPAGTNVFVYKELAKTINLTMAKGVPGSWVLKTEVNTGKR